MNEPKGLIWFFVGIAFIGLFIILEVWFDWILREIGWFILDPQYQKKTYTEDEFEAKEKKADRIGSAVFLIFASILVITFILIT